MDLEEAPDLGTLMRDVGASQTDEPVTIEPEQVQPESQPEEPQAQAEAQPAEALDTKPLEDPSSLVDRLLLSNPEQRQQYLQQAQGETVQPQPEAKSVEQPATPEFSYEQLLGGEYDPYNPQHQALIMQHKLNEMLKPFQEYISQQQEADKQFQQEQALAAMQKQREEGESYMLKVAEQHLPGYSKLMNSEAVEARFVTDFAQSLFAETMGQVYLNKPKLTPEQRQTIAFNKDVQRDVLNRIMPKVKQVYEKQFGQVQATPSLHVEGAASVPPSAGTSQTANALAKFQKSGSSKDLAGAMSAFTL